MTDSTTQYWAVSNGDLIMFDLKNDDGDDDDDIEDKIAAHCTNGNMPDEWGVLKTVVDNRERSNTHIEEEEDEEGTEEETICWDGETCKPDEFGCCVVCCECKACICNLQKAEDEEEEEEEEEEDEGEVIDRELVHDWFNLLEFDRETSWNWILDRAEKKFCCQFVPGMPAEVRSIHDWLSEKYKALDDEDGEEEDEEEEEDDDEEEEEEDYKKLRRDGRSGRRRG